MSLKIPPRPVRFVLTPGAEKTHDGPGTFVRVDEASGPFEIGFDLGTLFATSLGRWYQADAGQQFEKITVRNPSATATITVELLVLNAMQSGDDSLKVVSNRIGTLAQDGTDGTGIVPPAGAAGIRGWLSGIYGAVAGAEPLSVKVDGSSVTLNVDTTGLATEATAQLIAAALAAPLDVQGPLTSAQLGAAGLATEAKLEAVRALVATLATDAKAEAIRALLAGVLTVRDNPETLGALADVACGAAAPTKVIDSAATPHKTVTVFNKGSAEIRVGPNTAAAGVGAPVAAGGSITLRTSDSVYVYNPGGAFNAPVLFTN